jgi:G2/mitotic-specific cyclin-B, other
VGALLISTKYEEIYPPDLRDLLAVSENKFSREQVLQQEKDILHALNFMITSPSAYRFMERFRRLDDTFADKEVFFFAQYIQEVALLDASLLRFRPSQIAAASLILSTRQLKKKEVWGKELERFTDYSAESLSDAVAEVRSFCVEINPKFISTLRYKFSKPEYCKVANHPFKF